MACHLRTGFEWVALFGFATVAICVLVWIAARVAFPIPIEPEGDHDEPLGEASAYRREVK